MLRERGSAGKSSSPKKIFSGVRFVLFGFDSVSEGQYRSELVDRGGVDVGSYDSSCTHVVVSGRVFDEPICVAARNDGKILVTELWIDDSLGFGMLADSTKVLYRPVRDLNGIPGSESLHICLTGYQRQERDDIMVSRISFTLIWLSGLNAWEILPIDSYNKSGWELEMLEAEAMDSEEEAEDDGRKGAEQRSIAESHSLLGEMPVTVSSGSLVDARNHVPKKNILNAKPSDFSVNNHLISAPHKENCSGKAADICDVKSNVLNVNPSFAERPPGNHVMGIINSKQPNAPDLEDLSMKWNGLTSNISNGLVGMTSCEEDLKLGSPYHSRRNADKVVLPNEQFNNMPTPHKGKPKEGNKGDANITSAESKDEAAKKCTYDKFYSSMAGLNKSHVEGQTNGLPKKRKLLVSKKSSKSTMSDEDSRTSDLLDAPKSINPAELDFLKPHQRELENTLAHNETSTSRCQNVEDNDAFHQSDRISVSSSCLKSPELAQHDSGTCIIRSPSTSMRPRQIESMNVPHHEIDHGLTHTDGFEGTLFLQPGENQHVSLSKSSSITCKRKFVKHWQSASVANTSSNSSSISDKKDKLLSVPSKPALDGTVCTTDEPLSGVGTIYGITSPKATILSDCSLNNKTGQAKDRNMEKDPSFLRSPLTGDSGNANEVPISLRVLEAPLKNMRKSEADVKSPNFGGVSMKGENDIHNKVPEQHERPGEYQEVFPSQLKDAKVKDSVRTEITGSRKNGKVLVSRNMGCKPKPSRENCKTKSYSDSLSGTKSNKMLIKSGNGIVELGDADGLNEKVEKGGLPMKEKGKLEQSSPPGSKSNVITLDANHLDPEKVNELTDRCNFFVKEDDGYDRKLEKKCKSNLSAKRSSGDSSLPKPSCLNAVIAKTMWFILSGHQTQRKEFKKIINRLRGRICKDSHSWAYEATHFIVPDYVRRTQKFFAAAAAGRWILKSDYLTACGEAGVFLNEEPFEWYKKGLTEDGAISLEAPRKWRTMRERTGHGAFYGMRILIYGECIAPPLDTLKRAVKAGDGTILATSPPYTKFLKSSVDFAIVNASMPIADIWVQEFLSHEIPCVLSDYLVEYVCKPGYSLEKHILYKTHKWAEKSFANLLSRSEEIVSDEMSSDEALGDTKCVVCGSPDRGEVMLICGDEAGGRGCGVGTHIDCCDPPLVKVPEDDWFCSSCSGNVGGKTLHKTNRVKRKKSN
ncbi:hypothetical protein KFK09_001979 [Dendrobium nobile]|uniref:BRCT domain-containing protein n=1 Tax=Dendrobium nobile TaxID=94219 RepID=A0A8T3C6H6_DENNO|nr:hypothetical protein KFK09_001979 [Dendrobium nobile]